MNYLLNFSFPSHLSKDIANSLLAGKHYVDEFHEGEQPMNDTERKKLFGFFFGKTFDSSCVFYFFANFL